MTNNLKAYIGFAIKGGKVVFGYDNLIVSKKKVELVLISSEQNEKVTNKVIKFCEEKRIQCVKLDFALEEVLNRNCKVLGVIDSNLSHAILKELKMETVE